MKWFILIGLSLTFSLHAEEKEIIWGESLNPYKQRIGTWPTENTEFSQDETETEISEKLRRIPGIQARGDLSSGSPLWSLRGSGANGRVLGLFDGISLNLSDGFGPNSLLLPREIVESMELIKGPSSLFYGSDSMGGAFNFVPKRFKESRVKIEKGSFGQESALAVSPFSQGDKHHFQVSGLYDFIKGDFPYRNDRLSKSGTREFNNRTTHRLTFLGRHDHEIGAISEDLIFAKEGGSSPGSLTFPDVNDYNNDAALASVQIAPRFSSQLLGHFRASHALYETDTKTRTTGSQFITKSNKTTGTAQLSHSFSEHDSLTYFVDYNIDQYRSSALGDKVFTNSQAEGGVIYRGPIFADWTIQPGLRFVPNDSKFVPALGLFQEIPKGNVWLSYSEGFRKPTLAQKFASTSYLEGNPDLKPETSRQTEIGFEKEHNEYLTYGVTVYQIFYDQLISTESRLGKTTYVNIDSARAFGGDFFAAIKYDEWNGRLALSYLKTEDQNKNPLTMSPENQLTFSIGRSLGPVKVDIVDTYWTAYYDKDFVTGRYISLGPWNTVDILLASYGLNPWTISAGVLNMFDTPREFTLDYPEPQRRYYLSLARDF